MNDLRTDHQRRRSPLLLRRYLAQRIVELRENAGLTQGQVANQVRGISRPKLQYLELAKRALQDDSLLELLRLFEVPAAEHADWLALARDARAKGRYDHYDDTDLPSAARLAAEYEWGARRLRVFSGTIVPALLQTPTYTADLVTVHRAEHSAEQIASAVEVRRLRQEALDHPDPVEFHAIVDQAALVRTAHGVPGAAEQLEHIAEVAASRPNVTFQVVPWSAGHYRAQAGGFVLMDFGLPDHPGLLQVEPALVDPVHVDDRREIYLHSRAFDAASEVALSPDETIDLLQSVAGEVKGATRKGATNG